MDIESRNEGEKGIRRSLGRMFDYESLGEEELVRLVQEQEGKEPKIYAVCRGRDPETYELRYFMAVGKDPSSKTLESSLELILKFKKRLSKKGFNLGIRLLAAGQKEAAYYGLIVYEMPRQAKLPIEENP